VGEIFSLFIFHVLPVVHKCMLAVLVIQVWNVILCFIYMAIGSWSY